MKGFPALYNKEIFEFLRTWRALIVFIILLMIGLGSPLIASLTPQLIKALGASGQSGFEIVLTREPDVIDSLMQYHKNFGMIPILVILISMGAYAGERRRKILPLVLCKPVSRGAYVLAKMVAPATVYTVCVIPAIAGFVLYTNILFGTFDIMPFLFANLLFLLTVYFYIAVTIGASVLFDSTGVSAGVCIGVFALVSILGTLPGIGAWSPAGLMKSALSVFISADYAGAGSAILATLALITAITLIACRIAERQEV